MNKNNRNKNVKDTAAFDSKDVVNQMVDAIAGKEKENPTEQDKEVRRQLAGRACEYLMFMDDDD